MADYMSTSVRRTIPARSQTACRTRLGESHAPNSRRGGIWRYDENRIGQRFSPAERYVTGLRNGEGIVFDSAGRMFATMHGRDQLRENWPHLYTAENGADEPAEQLVQLERGADYG
jgi:glucose/arabinose dehydrogenase